MKERNKTMSDMGQQGAHGDIRDRRCVIVGFGNSAYDTGSGSRGEEDPVEAALRNALTAAGAESIRVARAWPPGDTLEMCEAIAGCDTMFFIGQKLLFSRKRKEMAWRMNVDATRYALSAAEVAGIGQIVMLGSILSLGQSHKSATDAETPYVSDDRRTVCERSLFRQEMEAWQMAERGMRVSVICGGLPLPYRSSSHNTATGDRHAKPRWMDYTSPAKAAEVFTTPDALAKALIAAQDEKHSGQRLICTGLRGDLGQTGKEPGSIRSIVKTLGIGETGAALRVVERMGRYKSDFPIEDIE